MVDFGVVTSEDEHKGAAIHIRRLWLPHPHACLEVRGPHSRDRFSISQFQSSSSSPPFPPPFFTARQCTVCSLVYCTHTNRYSSALDTWAVFHTSRMRRLYTSQNEHFAYTYDIAVCIRIRYIRHHLSAYFRWTRADSVHVMHMYSKRFKSIFCSAYLKASA